MPQAVLTKQHICDFFVLQATKLIPHCSTSQFQWSTVLQMENSLVKMVFNGAPAWKVSPHCNISFGLNQHILRYLKIPSGFGGQLRLKWAKSWQHWQQYLWSFRDCPGKLQTLAFIPSALTELSWLVWKVFIFPLIKSYLVLCNHHKFFHTTPTSSY